MKKSVIMSPWERQKDAGGKWKMVFKDHSLVVDLGQSLWVSWDYIISAPYSEAMEMWCYWQWIMAIWVNDGEPYIKVESMKKRIWNGDKLI